MCNGIGVQNLAQLHRESMDEDKNTNRPVQNNKFFDKRPVVQSKHLQKLRKCKETFIYKQNILEILSANSAKS